MKSVIMEIKGRDAIMLKRDGTFVKIRNRNYQRGQEIETPEVSAINGFSPARAAVSLLLVLMLTFSGFTFYTFAMPAGEISVDINPSIRLVINNADRVMRAVALNEDGEEVLASVSVEGMTAEQATLAILEAAGELGYIIEGESNEVVISVASRQEQKQLRLQERIRTALEAEEDVDVDEDEDEDEDGTDEDSGKSIRVTLDNPTRERVELAKEMGISPGRLVIIEKLQALDPEIETEDLEDTSIKELQSMIKELRRDGTGNNGLGNGVGNDNNNGNKAGKTSTIKSGTTGASPSVTTPASGTAAATTQTGTGQGMGNENKNKNSQGNGNGK
jgi:hypothetical protein